VSPGEVGHGARTLSEPQDDRRRLRRDREVRGLGPDRRPRGVRPPVDLFGVLPGPSRLSRPLGRDAEGAARRLLTCRPNNRVVLPGRRKDGTLTAPSPERILLLFRTGAWCPRDFPKGAQMTDQKKYSDPSRQGGGSHPSGEGHSSDRDREKDFGSRHEDEK